MKNVTFKNEFLYCNWDGFDHMIRCTVGLDQRIDGNALEEAVQQAATRYPYFCKKVVRNGETCDLVYNDAPIPVHPGNGTLVLGSEEANGHFLAVGYQDDILYLDIYHNMTDGKGVTEWAKTIIYLYLSKVLDEPLSPENIRIPGEEYLPGEIDDPYAAMEDKEYKVPDRTIVADKPFVYDERYTQSKERHNYMVRASVNDVIKMSKADDGSPVVVSIYYLKEALRQLYPEQADCDMLCGVPHSIRDVIGGPNNHHNLAVELTVKYDARTNALPRDMQFTCTRGSIAVQSIPKVIKSKILSRMKFDASLDDLSTVEERHKMYKNSIELVIDNNETMSVTYPGSIGFGSIEPHMRYLRYHCTALVAPIMIEIVPVNGWFYYSIVQNRTTDVYAKKFVELMQADGIAAEYVEDYGNELCGLYMP